MERARWKVVYIEKKLLERKNGMNKKSGNPHGLPLSIYRV